MSVEVKDMIIGVEKVGEDIAVKLSGKKFAEKLIQFMKAQGRDPKIKVTRVYTDEAHFYVYGVPEEFQKNDLVDSMEIKISFVWKSILNFLLNDVHAKDVKYRNANDDVEILVLFDRSVAQPTPTQNAPIW